MVEALKYAEENLSNANVIKMNVAISCTHGLTGDSHDNCYYFVATPTISLDITTANLTTTNCVNFMAENGILSNDISA
jgi:hypothetical protein